MGVQQHQVLGQEFDIGETAPALFQVDLALGLLLQVGAHLGAHLQHFLAQFLRVARAAQHLGADLGEGGGGRRVAGDRAGAAQRLVFPGPGVVALIFGKAGHAADQHPGGAAGP